MTPATTFTWKRTWKCKTCSGDEAARQKALSDFSGEEGGMKNTEHAHCFSNIGPLKLNRKFFNNHAFNLHTDTYENFVNKKASKEAVDEITPTRKKWRRNERIQASCQHSLMEAKSAETSTVESKRLLKQKVQTCVVSEAVILSFNKMRIIKWWYEYCKLHALGDMPIAWYNCIDTCIHVKSGMH